ncbi:hypothetical protein RCO28_18745 [Streptomyces sp. LHD-70]|uniref:hypothetical protein n=1 Tax=Streptomyces sp. LHD-70 TaxID=3072140 RepID=UPI0028107491|nr:hypothetical protein [Streptomyces sp. LHD-70]MDQ8704511.1 hypothetical protein [Streptomyces sp. LHD-70]
MDITNIAAIVLAARIVHAPTEHHVDDGDGDGDATVYRLSLHGQNPGQTVDFIRREGHRRWCLEAVTDDHGTAHPARTLGRRLSARLTELHTRTVNSPTAP